MTEDEATELYLLAKGLISPHYLGNAGLQGLLQGNWPEQAVAIGNGDAPAQGDNVGDDAEDFDNPVAPEDSDLSIEDVEPDAELDMFEEEALGVSGSGKKSVKEKGKSKKRKKKEKR